MTKKALVTGASEGIGREFAGRLASTGYLVTAVARNEARLEDLIKELGDGHKYIVADLTHPSGLEKVVEELEKDHYDLLVNNAGYGGFGKFYEIELEKSRNMMNLNLDALVALAHRFLKQAQKGDALINISSVLAMMPFPQQGVYSATKAFVSSFSESLWYEQRSRGVYVLGLCPGATVTEFAGRAGISNEDIPAFMLQTSAQVVSVGLKALKKRKKPTVVSGNFNRFNILLSRIMTRKAVVKMMGSFAPKT